MKLGQSRAQPSARSRIVLAARMEKPNATGWHSHRELQWINAGSGVATVETEGALWLALPGQALTIASNVAHNIDWFGPGALVSVYLEPNAVAFESPEPCCLTTVSPLLDAAAAALVPELEARPAAAGEARVELIAGLVLDEIPRRRLPSYGLPLPSGRLSVLCRQFVDRPSDAREVDECAEAVGMSRRTFTRQFRQKTGRSFVDWRRQLRVMRAIALRMEGQSSKRIAETAGYDSVQSLHAEVKKAFGRTLGSMA